MSDLSNETEALLRAAAGADEPTSADRERVRRGVIAGLAAGATGLAASSAQAATSAGTAKAGAATKLGALGKLAIVAALVGGGVGLVLWRTSAEPRRAPVSVAPAPAPALPLPAVVPAPRVVVVEPPSARDAGPAGPSVPVPPPVASMTVPSTKGGRARPGRDDGRARKTVGADATQATEASPSSSATLARETAALRAVRTALREHDPAAALAALAAYARSFPDGVLEEEAGALQVETLCALGRTSEAAQAAAKFLVRHPGSLHAARVERGCEGGTVEP